MRQLTATDATFLNIERPGAPMHLTSLLIFDQSDRPDGRVVFQQILDAVEERSAALPTYRQRLLKVPFDLGYPWWYDDGTIDVEAHVRHMTLPEPRDWAQLCMEVGRLHSRPLDMAEPLWELTVIDGLDHVEGVPAGSFAMVLKTHHCAIDGASGMQVLATLLDPEPNTPKIKPSVTTPDTRPTRGHLIRKAMTSAAQQQTRLVKTVATGLPAVGDLIRHVGEVRSTPDAPNQAPTSRFGGEVTAERAIEGTSIDMFDLLAVRNLVAGATINDVVLSIVGGTLRRYLAAHDEVPDKSLVAAVPISLRREGDTDPGNQVSLMTVPLHTDIADPIERLGAIGQSAAGSKEMSQALIDTHLIDAASQMPAALVTFSTRLAAQLGVGQQARRLFNTAVTNVPGTREPSYTCGARLVSHFGFGPLQNGAGLFHCVMGVEKRLFLAVTACPEMLPDAAFYRHCMEKDIAEHVAATRTRADRSDDSA
ncbi:MAG: wax ester/triacylglycerol synthase family O-acyltransferase [Actinomycetia bacterium]|nr:wax ester/triacylglycerol synthase family O-acyltransferase [Actinomycetes bacterium]